MAFLSVLPNNKSNFPCVFLPEMLFLHFCSTMQPFNWQSLKDNFHNLILGIDKKVNFDTLILLRRISANT
jgi:hypothetical protein